MSAEKVVSFSRLGDINRNGNIQQELAVREDLHVYKVIWIEVSEELSQMK